MQLWRYRYQGLAVVSEIEVPEWSAFEIPLNSGSSFREDATIRLGGFKKEEEPCQGEYRFFARHTGWFAVGEGREIRIPGSRESVDGETDAARKRLRTFLLGTAWGALMYQRRALLLHASAVRVGNGAVAFCGRRLFGKSTLAAWLSTLGYGLVSDDLCCIRLSPEEPPQVYPSVVRFRLCDDALAKIGWEPLPMHRDQLQPGKYHFYPTDQKAFCQLPLRRIYLLGWGDPEIRRLRGFNALTRLVAAGTWRSRLLTTSGDPAAHFSQYAELLREVECWEFRRPRTLDLLATSVSELTKHMSDLQN